MVPKIFINSRRKDVFSFSLSERSLGEPDDVVGVRGAPWVIGGTTAAPVGTGPRLVLVGGVWRVGDSMLTPVELLRLFPVALGVVDGSRRGLIEVGVDTDWIAWPSFLCWLDMD